MQNNIEFAQDGFGVEETHVEQDVPTYELQRLVSWKQTNENCSWFIFRLSKSLSTIEDLKGMERSDLDVIVQHVELDVLACAVP